MQPNCSTLVLHAGRRRVDFEYVDAEFRDGVTKDEIDDVFWDGRDFELPPSDRGNNRAMYVGFTSKGRLIEVGVEFLSKTKVIVFHAMVATKPYQKRFEKDR